jgi:hypothetical protein
MGGMKLAVVLVVTVLVTAGSTFAATAKWITIHKGDNLLTKDGKVLCIGTSANHALAVTCSPVSSKGKVVAVTGKLGVDIVVNGKSKMACLSDGFCKK